MAATTLLTCRRRPNEEASQCRLRSPALSTFGVRDASHRLQSPLIRSNVGGKSDAVYIAQILSARCSCSPCCRSLLQRRPALVEQPGWDGKRQISYQQQKDLFYNYYAQPGPYNGAAAGMYVCPRPVPANVGHTWVTYQPFMPHEYLYKHERSYYTYNPGAGWRRTNVRYGTCGLRCQENFADLHFPMSNQHLGTAQRLLSTRCAVVEGSRV